MGHNYNVFKSVEYHVLPTDDFTQTTDKKEKEKQKMLADFEAKTRRSGYRDIGGGWWINDARGGN